MGLLIKKYKILNHLPSSGKMYISVTDNDSNQLVSEGFVVRFYKKDGTNWVANFELGETNFSFVKDWINSENILVIANGKGYLMNPESEKPIKVFGETIKRISEISNDYLVIIDNREAKIINEKASTQWKIDLISWEGIKELEVKGNILTGLFFNPQTGKWDDFKINLNIKDTNNIIDYRKYYTSIKKTKPWWKIWK